MFFCTNALLHLNGSVTLWVTFHQNWTDLWMSCHQGQHLYHNANNLPLWTWWKPLWCWLLQVVETIRDIKQHQKHQNTLPLWHQGQRVDQIILPIWYTSCCPWSPLVHAKSTNICFKRITWLYNSNKWVWPPYDQWLIHTSITQPNGDTPHLTHPPSQIRIYQLFIHEISTTNITSSIPCKVGIQITSFIQ